MGFPWDSRSHWESHSHAHLYSESEATAVSLPTVAKKLKSVKASAQLVEVRHARKLQTTRYCRE